MGGDPIKHNQGLYCQYHQDRGHTTKGCRTLRDYLEQLVKIGKLRQFLHQPSGHGSLVGSTHQQENPLRPSLGTINVILAAVGWIGMYSFEVMFVSSSHTKDPFPKPKRGKM